MPEGIAVVHAQQWLLRWRAERLRADMRELQNYGSAELKARYRDHAAYLREVDEETQDVLDAGFILPHDAEHIGKSAVWFCHAARRAESLASG